MCVCYQSCYQCCQQADTTDSECSLWKSSYVALLLVSLDLLSPKPGTRSPNKEVDMVLCYA